MLDFRRTQLKLNLREARVTRTFGRKKRILVAWKRFGNVVTIDFSFPEPAIRHMHMKKKTSLEILRGKLRKLNSDQDLQLKRQK